jgi:hypothetical protein
MKKLFGLWRPEETRHVVAKGRTDFGRKSGNPMPNPPFQES